MALACPKQAQHSMQGNTRTKTGASLALVLAEQQTP